MRIHLEHMFGPVLVAAAVWPWVVIRPTQSLIRVIGPLSNDESVLLPGSQDEGTEWSTEVLSLTQEPVSVSIAGMSCACMTPRVSPNTVTDGGRARVSVFVSGPVRDGNSWVLVKATVAGRTQYERVTMKASDRLPSGLFVASSRTLVRSGVDRLRVEFMLVIEKGHGEIVPSVESFELLRDGRRVPTVFAIAEMGQPRALSGTMEFPLPKEEPPGEVQYRLRLIGEPRYVVSFLVDRRDPSR